MVKALFDTNILIDFLRGVHAAREELGRYQLKAISLVTWMEVLVGATPATERGTREFLNGFELVPIDQGIAERAVALRRLIASSCPTPSYGLRHKSARCSL